MPHLDLRDLAGELAELEVIEADSDAELDEEERERLTTLHDLQAQLFTDTLADYAENAPEMIPEEDFEEYAQDLANDRGYLKDSDPLHAYIDWARWANALQYDYTKVTFDGVPYLIRAY